MNCIFSFCFSVLLLYVPLRPRSSEGCDRHQDGALSAAFQGTYSLRSSHENGALVRVSGSACLCVCNIVTYIFKGTPAVHRHPYSNERYNLQQTPYRLIYIHVYRATFAAPLFNLRHRRYFKSTLPRRTYRANRPHANPENDHSKYFIPLLFTFLCCCC